MQSCGSGPSWIRIRDADSGSGSSTYKITKKLKNIKHFFQDFLNLFWRNLTSLNFASMFGYYQSKKNSRKTGEKKILFIFVFLFKKTPDQVQESGILIRI